MRSRLRNRNSNWKGNRAVHGRPKPGEKNPLLNRWISQYVNYISIKLLIRKRISAAPGALWQTAGNRTKKIHSIAHKTCAQTIPFY